MLTEVSSNDTIEDGTKGMASGSLIWSKKTLLQWENVGSISSEEEDGVFCSGHFLCCSHFDRHRQIVVEGCLIDPSLRSHLASLVHQHWLRDHHHPSNKQVSRKYWEWETLFMLLVN